MNRNKKCPSCKTELCSRVGKKPLLFISALAVIGFVKIVPLLETTWHGSYLIAGMVICVYVYAWFQKFEIKTNS